jgi:hypothetical protein
LEALYAIAFLGTRLPGFARLAFRPRLFALGTGLLAVGTALFTVAARLVVTATLAIVAELATWRPRLTLVTLLLLLRLRTLVLLLTIASITGLITILIAVLGHIVALAAARLLETRTVLVQDAKIVIRELQIIFGLNAIAAKLGVARHRFELLVKLGGIAARAIVLTVAAAGRATRARPAAATAATAAVLTIVDQMVILVTGGLSSPLQRSGPSRPNFLHDTSGWDRSPRLPPPHARIVHKTPQQSGVGDRGLTRILKL